jgi:hypothetical protein
MKNLHFTGDWKDGNATVTVNLPVMIFEEEGTHIAYIPVLDLCGYGTTEMMASESLKIAVSEYFTYTVRKNTLLQDLKAHGWTVKKKNKPYIAPEITDLLTKNEYLHDIVNTKRYRMDRMPVDLPQYA